MSALQENKYWKKISLTEAQKSSYTEVYGNTIGELYVPTEEYYYLIRKIYASCIHRAKDPSKCKTCNRYKSTQ